MPLEVFVIFLFVKERAGKNPAVRKTVEKQGVSGAGQKSHFCAGMAKPFNNFLSAQIYDFVNPCNGSPVFQPGVYIRVEYFRVFSTVYPC